MRTWTAGGGGRWGGGGGWETEKKSRGNKILKSVRVTCVGAEISRCLQKEQEMEK